MRKFIFLSAIVMFAGSTLFTSCSSEEDPQVSLQDQLLSDQAFEDASISTLDFVVTAVSHNWLQNMARVNSIVNGRPIGDLSNSELTQINNLLGMSLEDFLKKVEDFSLSVNDLYVNNPQLADLSQAESNALFAEAINNSSTVTDYMSGLQENARSGPLDWVFCAIQEACYSNIEGIVPIVQETLAHACEVVSGIELPIPFLETAEDMLCNVLPGYVESFLPGICDYIPCED